MKPPKTYLALALALALATGLLAASATSAQAAEPTIANTAAANLTTTSATLQAEVDPKGKRTEYQFSYVDQATFDAEGFASPIKLPIPEGKLPATVTATGDLQALDSSEDNGPEAKTITNVTVSAGNFGVGQEIKGAGIPAETEIIAVDPAAKTLTISHPATASANGVALTATGPQPVSVSLSELTPFTTYHFKLSVHHSSEAPVESPEVIFATYSTPPAFGPCPNDAFRIGSLAPLGNPSARLPDCRAYEQASPVDKNGADARGRVNLAKAAADGNAVSFVTTSPLPGEEGAQDVPVYLATRGASDWSTHGMLPPSSSGAEAFISGWTPDFSQVFSTASRFDGVGGLSFLSRAFAQGPLSTIVPFDGGLQTQCHSPGYVGASADGSQVYFESRCKLLGTPAALEGKPNVYLWNRDTQSVSLVTVMNDGTAPPNGAFAGPYDWMEGHPDRGGLGQYYYTQDDHTISDDGSLYFTEANTGQLNLRQNPTEPQSPLDGQGKCTNPALACTVHVSATHKTNGIGPGNSDSAGTRPAAFMEATPDGSKVFFTSSEKLTNDSTTGPEPPPAAIARANLADGLAKDLSFLPAKASGLTVAGQYLYWADPEGHAIGRATLDGSGDLVPGSVEPDFILPGPTEFETHPLLEPGVLHSAPATPSYVAVEGENIYWTNTGPLGGDFKFFGITREEHPLAGAGTIGRASLDGSGALVPGSVNADFITGATNPHGIDAQSQYLYWANGGEENPHHTEKEEELNESVGRAELSGTDVKQAFIAESGGGQGPQGIAVDAAHIFIGINSSQNFSRICRFDIGGNPGSRKCIFNGKGIDAEERQTDAAGAEALGIAIDASHVYWARPGRGAIARADLDMDEASAEYEFIKEAGRPKGLTIDGEHVYWSANQGSPPNPGNDLYRFDSASQTLTDLVPDTQDPNGAQVVGVLGASEDGSYLYFVANGDLDGPGPAQTGNCRGLAFGSSGHCSLYLLRDGEPTTVKFIATLKASVTPGTPGEPDSFDWLARGNLSQEQKTSRVSANGKTLLFRSQEQLTSYDNKGVSEFYLYQPESGISCVSCDPTGVAPTGTPSLGSTKVSTIFPNELTFVLSRVLSTDGKRVFFQTTDALVGQDTNANDGCPPVGSVEGKNPSCLDVYEWEAEGTGSCTEDMQGGGCLYLLSPGTDSDGSLLADASASGDDVFFLTRSQLVGQDQDRLFDVYDARAQGGLASQNQARSVPCEGEGCRPAPTPQTALASPATHSFVGQGNLKKRRHRPHHKGKRHHPKAKGRPAGAARRTPR